MIRVSPTLAVSSEAAEFGHGCPFTNRRFAVLSRCSAPPSRSVNGSCSACSAARCGFDRVRATRLQRIAQGRRRLPRDRRDLGGGHRQRRPARNRSARRRGTAWKTTTRQSHRRYLAAFPRSGTWLWQTSRTPHRNVPVDAEFEPTRTPEILCHQYSGPVAAVRVYP